MPYTKQYTYERICTSGVGLVLLTLYDTSVPRDQYCTMYYDLHMKWAHVMHSTCDDTAVGNVSIIFARPGMILALLALGLLYHSPLRAA